MSEMIERVAKALQEALEDPAGNFDVRPRECYVKCARAAIAAMREPTVEMTAAAFPCDINEQFRHEDMQHGAAVCLRLGGGAHIGLLEGEAVKQAAFMVRDYRLMIEAALEEKSPTA
jgi:hypothetical protein